MLHEGRLARAVLAEDRDRLARLDRRARRRGRPRCRWGSGGRGRRSATRTGGRAGRRASSADAAVWRLVGRPRRPSRDARLASRREAGRDRGLVERLREVDAGRLRQADERRRRAADRDVAAVGERRAGHVRARWPGRHRGRGSGPSGRARSGRARRTGSSCRPGRARRGGRRRDAVPAGSSWAVGSSRTRTVVPIATMLAMATRCCSPPDRANGSRSARWPIARRASVASIRASISSRGTPRFSSPNASSSRTVSFEAESWLAGVAKTIPTRPSSAPRRRGRRVDAPRSTTRPVDLGPDDARDEPRGGERQGRLAGAGPAGHADPLAGGDREVDAREARLAPGRIAARRDPRSGAAPPRRLASSLPVIAARSRRPRARRRPRPARPAAAASGRSAGRRRRDRRSGPAVPPNPRASSANVRSRTSTSDPSRTGVISGTSARIRRDERAFQRQAARLLRLEDRGGPRLHARDHLDGRQDDERDPMARPAAR